MALRICSRCKKRPAVIFITRVEGDKSTPEGVCIQCAKELGIKPIDDMLKSMDIPDEDIDAMNDQLMQLMDTIKTDEGSPEEFSPGGAATFPFLKNIFGENSGDAPAGANRNRPDELKSAETQTRKNRQDKSKKRKYLDAYCTNLTKRAAEGNLDRIIGREKELYRVIQILSRRTKNNPCLIGEPGVGKTAIAEGLALKISSGDINAKLRDKEIHLLDLTALVAGTQFRGQFESRVKGLVDEVKSDGNVILFIDELHNLVGTGDAEGSMNAANILKPALSRGEIQVIGATTFKEYRKYIEKDAALERRFQPVTIEEPSIDSTIQVLMGVKDYYEGYH
ncbi:MAG TPA: chaperone ClpB, partial [Ruminococcaceae bacterium]|nr:chaperone ClpB [Oscillospiraceae bacterium]